MEFEWREGNQSHNEEHVIEGHLRLDFFQAFALINAPQVKLQTETHFVLSDI